MENGLPRLLVPISLLAGASLGHKFGVPPGEAAMRTPVHAARLQLLGLRGGEGGAATPGRRGSSVKGESVAASPRKFGGALPAFEHTAWRINASRPAGAWPGPATTLLVPTDEEFAEFGNGRQYPGRDGGNVTLMEFVRLFA